MSNFKQMYAAFTNARSTTTTGEISDEQTSVTVVDASVLPVPPCLVTIGFDLETVETVLITQKIGNVLTLERGVSGAALTWAAGTRVCRVFSAKDLNDMQYNIKLLNDDKLEEVGTDDLNDEAVTNAKLRMIEQNRIKGRISPETGSPEDLTPQEVVRMLTRGAVGIIKGSADGDLDAAEPGVDYETPESKVTQLSDQVTNDQYPSAKCVYDALMQISENVHPKFGVSGVGGSSPALTRLWDAVGKTATPGTDSVAGSSDFDEYAPFNRRKCVGSWAVVGEKAVFTPRAYSEDADYAEDGSMGDYVAIDVTPFWWYESPDKSTLGVSGGPQTGWTLHPICKDVDGNMRMHTYLPAYPLAVNADGHAVSLPGYHPAYGAYKTLWDTAKTYGDEAIGAYATITPSAASEYEWLLMTIEYATENMQSVMSGAIGMRYTQTDKVKQTAVATNSVVVDSACGNAMIVGQTIYLSASYDSTPPSPASYNSILSIEACDIDGTLNATGSYRLITFDGAGRDVTADTTIIMSRPWKTGVCSTVLGHTGSIVSNTSKYQCMYRWHENPYANITITALDLMDVRVDEGNETYHIEWYHLPDPRTYYPSSTSKPDLADLTTPDLGWQKLSVQTPPESYANGYIKEMAADPDYPYLQVPVNTVGGSSETYYCDYAYLVHSPVVRAVRRGGHVISGANAGPRSVSAINAPSNAYWAWGAELFMLQ